MKINRTFYDSGITQMFLSTFSFAMANVFVKQLSNMPVLEIVFFRSIVAGVLCAYGIRKTGVDWRGNNKRFLILRGVAGTVALVLFFITLQNIPLATATTIQYLSPIFTATIAIFFLKESIRVLQWLFYAMAFSGVVLIKSFDPRISLFYLMIGIIAALGSGIAYNFVRSLRDSEKPLVIIFYFQIIGLVVSVPALFFSWKTPGGADWFYLVLVGLFSYLGQIFLTNAFSREKAASVAIIVYTGLVYAITIGWFFYGEEQTVYTFAGMALVVGGVVLSILYGRRRNLMADRAVEAAR
ncbi:MAG: DMT family transporter [Acidobacteriota bacterium]|nr:DMT family transporter [Acidobacteriota bacterium]MDH3529972.1 DMT family transporter [Acidobacteriota bacterium]